MIFDHTRLTIIGGGNIGSCLVGGLIQQGFPKQHLFIFDRHVEKSERLHAQWQINISPTIEEAVTSGEGVLFAIKPSSMKSTLSTLSALFQHTPRLIMSVAAGITTHQILQWIGQSFYPIIKAMPNTPALYGHGMTALFANEAVLPDQRDFAHALFSSVGKVLWLHDESQMNSVTALSGSGPAYFFYIMECLIQGAEALGLPKEIARELTLNTALGSVIMALRSQDTLSVLRETVTSPGGTTERGIQALKDGNMGALLQQALAAATRRGKELSELYS